MLPFTSIIANASDLLVGVMFSEIFRRETFHIINKQTVVPYK